MYTTGAAGFEGCVHIEADENGIKDFSAIIEQAKKCKAPTEIEQGEIIGGFAHAQVLALVDQVVEAVKSALGDAKSATRKGYGYVVADNADESKVAGIDGVIRVRTITK
jgi:hypothetical protein